ncbi:MAG: hypothetical protein V3T41_00030 [bacterium]
MLGETESGVASVRRGESRAEANGAQVGLTADLAFFFGVRLSAVGKAPTAFAPDIASRR